jgi:hypothetical protein
MSELPQVQIAKILNDGWDLLQSQLSPGRLERNDHNYTLLIAFVEKRGIALAHPGSTPDGVAYWLMLGVEHYLFNTSPEKSLQWALKPSKFFVDQVQQKITYEYEVKERKRREKEAAENRKEFSNTAQVENEKATKEEAKLEATATAYIDQLVENFTINGRVPNTIDYAATDACRAALRRIKIYVGGKYSAQATLAIVQQAFYGQTPSEIASLAEKARLKMIENQTRKAGGRDSMGGDVRKVGRLGGVN